MQRGPERICLITPPSGFLSNDRVFPSLGILKVAAMLEQAGTVVEKVDLSGVPHYPNVMRDHAKDSPSQIFGLTATTPQMPAATEIVRSIREARPDARILLGGPHATLVHTAYKKELLSGKHGRATRAMRILKEMFDVVVAGDGESAIFFACNPNAPKIIDADNKESPYFQKNVDLDRHPFPARHLIDLSTYQCFVEGIPALSLITQLGCPFECNFCGGRDSPMLRSNRRRSSESVVAEMLHLYHAYGVQGFMLYDDELNVNRKLVELMELIAITQKKLGVEWRLRGFIKAELFTDAQAAAMRKAGFRWILTGFESGSPRILENIKKHATREENTRCMEIARRHDLKVKALMSIGHPGENEESVQSTLDWLLEMRPDEFDVSIITSYPGTPIYDRAVPHPILDEVWTYTLPNGDNLHQIEVDYTKVSDYYKGNPNKEGGYRAYVFTDSLSAEDLVRERDRIERTVRTKLALPYSSTGTSIEYEHSMGQRGPIPQSILRVSHK